MTNEEAIWTLQEAVDEAFGAGIEIITRDGCEAIEMAIEALKERKTGKWFDNVDIYDKRAQKHDYFCLECKTHAMDFVCGSEDWWCCKPPKHCPNCGAKMEVDDVRD